MGVSQWLIDTSALLRLPDALGAEEWANRITRGLVHIATVTKLEVGYSARSAAAMTQTRDGPLVKAMPQVFVTPAIEHRALEVQLLLADRGHHRAPSVADLLVASAAEQSGMTVLHVDRDFELIAEVTGQAVERLALA